ncbi:FAAR193Cp [Eremothecium gossypii FDAG1]|nr:FAAR193Cp [Eremothecium gossypii FDAG1]
MSATQQADVDDILSFVQESGGRFLRPQCSIQLSPEGGLGVFAAEDIAANTVLLRVPKSAVFSAPNSSIANLLLEEGLHGMLALVIAFIYETTGFRNASHWCKYLHSIRYTDARGNLVLPPSFWPAKSKHPLRVTALNTLHHALDAEPEVVDGYERAVACAYKWRTEADLPIPPLLRRPGTDDQRTRGLRRFVAVTYALASRAFDIDDFHGNGLVPIADLFNHHVTRPHVRFEAAADVCVICGESGPCGHSHTGLQAESQPLLPNAELCVREPVERPVSLTAKIQEDHAADTSTGTPPEASWLSFPADDCVDIRAVADIRRDTEIYNTYGELSNPLLLARYGFRVLHNPHDVAHFAPEVRRLCNQGGQGLVSRLRWWQQTGYALYCKVTGASDDGDSWQDAVYADSSGEPSPALWALAELLSGAGNGWRMMRRSPVTAASVWSRRNANGGRNRRALTVLRRLAALKRALLLAALPERHSMGTELLEDEISIVNRLLEKLGRSRKAL